MNKILNLFINRTLSTKLIIGILFCMVVGFIILTLLVSYKLEPVIKDRIISESNEEMALAIFDIYKNVAVAEQAIYTTSSILSEQTSLSEKELLDYSQATLESLYNKHKFFNSLWIYVIPKNEKEKGFMYQSNIRGNKIVEKKYKEKEEFNTQEWKTETLYQDGVYWAEPFDYIDPNGDRFFCISVSIPFKLKNSSNFTGIVGLSIDLRQLQSRITERNAKEEGKLLLLSQKGRYLVHPNPEFQMNKTVFDLAKEYNLPQLKTVGDELAKGNSGLASMSNSLLFKSDVVFVYSPIPKINWGACLVYSKAPFFEPIKQFEIVIFVITIVGMIILFLIVRFICDYITNPLKKLAIVANEYGEGQFSAQLPNITSKDEIGTFTKAFSNMKNNLLELIEEKQQEAIETQKRNSELEIAKQIQKSALPINFPKNENVDLYASMTPAREVGGDFYDFFFKDENHIVFLIADVSGKGIPAALFMMNAKNILKNSIEKETSLDEAINKANNIICSSNDAGLFVTSFICILDIKTGILEYVNAGHNPPLFNLLQQGYDYLRTKGNIVLGAFDNVHYKSQKIQLNIGDTLFLYTDGVTEAQNIENKFYGEDKLKICINSKNLSPRDIIELVKSDVDRFANGRQQFDDITMICLKYMEQKI